MKVRADSGKNGENAPHQTPRSHPRNATTNLRLKSHPLHTANRDLTPFRDTHELNDHTKIPFHGLRQGVVLENLCFSYGRRGDVLKAINLEIPSGKTVAIVGESGSGKSTLLRLIMGLYLPTDGRLLIDGVDIRDFDLSSLRQGIGLVSQDPFIFSGTIAENIAFGRPAAPAEQIIEATRAAGLEQFVGSQPDRYQTMLGERGANVSGGQRQRLAIARALLCQPEILIFDEATSHLDSATERAIQHSLETVLEGKTVVLVAHRLSTIRRADRIYVLDQGRVLEQGTHEELMRQQGRYAELWETQVGSTESDLQRQYEEFLDQPFNGTKSAIAREQSHD